MKTKIRCGECGTTDLTQGQASKTFGVYDVALCNTCEINENALTESQKLHSTSTALTDADMMHNLSSNDMLIAFQRTPRNFIKQRPGRGNKPLNYVEGHYMQRCLTALTNFNWSSTIEKIEIIGDSVVCHGFITLVLDDDRIIKLSQCGSSKIKYRQGTKDPVDIGDDFKSAATDTWKKCASMIGIAHDVYSGEVKLI